VNDLLGETPDALREVIDLLGSWLGEYPVLAGMAEYMGEVPALVADS